MIATVMMVTMMKMMTCFFQASMNGAETVPNLWLNDEDDHDDDETMMMMTMMMTVLMTRG